MNSLERFRATLAFEPIDRPLLWECGYWAATIRRWYREGLPERHGIPGDRPDGRSVWPTEALDVADCVQLDPFSETMPVNLFVYPHFKEEVLEDHGEWVLIRTGNGGIERQRKDRLSIPSRVAGPVKSREDWEQFKAERLQPVLEDRLPSNWPELVAKYKQRETPLIGPSCEHWLMLVELVGLESLLVMFHDDPNLLRDMIKYLTHFWVTMYDKLLRQVVPDMMTVGGDFCYKVGPLFSPAAFREFFMPAWQEVTSLMRSYGVPAIIVHTDGDCRKLIPEFIEAGATGLHPWEVTNGQNIVDVREAFPQFQIFGGINKLSIADGKESTDLELESKVPFMLQHSGWVPYIDHAVSPDISWPNFLYYRDRLEKMFTA